MRKRVNYLWLAVTPDQYELPLVVCDTADELAARFNVSTENVQSLISKNSSGKRSGRKFVKVRVK